MFPSDTKFLIVDDLKTIRALIRDILEKMGYSDLHEAADGKQALNMLKEGNQSGQPYGFIIADWNMPEMTGLDLLEACKGDEQLNNTPFLMVTIESERSYVLRAVTMGVDDFVVKPFSEKTFEDKLRSIWERRNSAN